MSQFIRKLKEYTASHASTLLLGKQVTTAVVCIALLLVAAIPTVAWYREHVETESGADSIDSASTDNTQVSGHDTYRYNIESGRGELVNGENVSMNPYDTIFTEGNEYTPIILRAVMRGVEQGTDVDLIIKSACIEALKANGATDVFLKDTGNVSGYKSGIDGANIENYLSNVVNVRAAYIPGLATDAESGKFDHGVYKDMDDYIYQMAVKAMNGEATKYNVAPSERVNFIEETPGVAEHDADPVVTYIVTKVTNADMLAKATDVDTFPKKKYELQGYLIASGNNYLGIEGTSVTNFSSIVPDKGYFNEQEYTEALTGNLKKCIWVHGNESGDIQLTPGSTTFYNRASSRWIQRNTTSLRAYTGSTDWTLGINSQGITLSSVYGKNYYINYSTRNGWTSLTTTSTTIQLYKIEKCTTIDKVEAIPTSYDNKVSVPVDLAAAQEGDSGFYYVYLMMDYDNELVKKYNLYNDIAFSIGQENEGFEDYFSINPVFH